LFIYFCFIPLFLFPLFFFFVACILQQSLSLAKEWCTSQGLELNPAKTTVVPFTRLRKLDFRIPKIGGQEVQLSNSVKYLGLLFDRHLTWNAHLEEKLRKASNIFCACRRAYGKTWGLKPKVVSWLYKAMVIPAITYGSCVWWPATNNITSKSKLNKLQRLACVGISGAMHSTPTATME